MTLSYLNRRTFLRLAGSALAAIRILPAKAELRAPAQSGSSGATTGTPRIVIYPAPQGEVLSSDYAIEVNGRPVPVYVMKSQWRYKKYSAADLKYSAAYFDFSGRVTVTIRPNLSAIGVTPSLDQLVVRPEKYGIRPSIANGVLSFTTDKPFNISVEPNGEHRPLHLFSNPIEENPPKPGDPGVIYFGPGVHTPTHIALTAGQTLYIAGGAVVNAAVTSTGDNIRIMGRGILSGDNWPHFQGPAERMVGPSDGRHILIEDIIIRGSWTWTVVPSRCNQVLIRNLRICGSRCLNDDGIDSCSSSNVTIRDCFVHTADDGMCVKRTTLGDQNPRAPENSENIVVEDSTFWIDFANGFRIAGDGTLTRGICRNFVARNIDFIHFPSNPDSGPPGSGGPQSSVFQIQPQNELPMENLAFNNIRINGEKPLQLIGITCSWTTKPAANEHPVGPYVHNVTFSDVKVYGHHKGPELSPFVFMQGADAEHDIENIVLRNVVLHGKKVTQETAGVQIGKFVSGVVFEGPSTGVPQ